MASAADFIVKVTFYGIAVFISVGGTPIGMELLNCFVHEEVGFAGKWGLVILISVVPAFYLIGIALLLQLEPWWLVGGIVMVFVILESLGVYSFYSSRRASKAPETVDHRTEKNER